MRLKHFGLQASYQNERKLYRSVPAAFKYVHTTPIGKGRFYMNDTAETMSAEIPEPKHCSALLTVYPFQEALSIPGQARIVAVAASDRNIHISNIKG